MKGANVKKLRGEEGGRNSLASTDLSRERLASTWLKQSNKHHKSELLGIDQVSSTALIYVLLTVGTPIRKEQPAIRIL